MSIDAAGHTAVVTSGGPAGQIWFAVDPIVFECTAEAIVVSSPRAARRLRIEPAVAALLLAARTGLRETDADRARIRILHREGFLVDQPSGETVESPWQTWGVTAWNFHEHTRNVAFVGGRGQPEEVTRAHFERVIAEPRPSTVRTEDTGRILLLPRVRAAMPTSFREVLETRRTHRDFEHRQLDLDRFADMLHYSFAPLRFADAGPLGVLQLRASASGGARHETEAFVAVFDVADVRPGLYHYDNIRHGLVPVGAATREQFEWLIFEQGFCRNASFAVLTAAMSERMSWKYRHPRAYKMLLQNVGHVAQVFSMTAAALGLGAAITGAIRDTEADELLGLAPGREFVTFAMACGHPLRRADGLPLSIRLPQEATD